MTLELHSLSLGGEEDGVVEHVGEWRERGVCEQSVVGNGKGDERICI